jgi:hypothetical protein
VGVHVGVSGVGRRGCEPDQKPGQRLCFLWDREEGARPEDWATTLYPHPPLITAGATVLPS